MSDITLDLITHEYNNPSANIIRQYTATTASDNTTFKQLVELGITAVAGYTDPQYQQEFFLSLCLEGEKEVLDYMETLGERCTYRRKDGTIDTKKGKDGYKISKVCSKSTYSSAKAIVANCIGEGVSLTNDDGSIRGKTELEKALKSKKDTDSGEVDGDDEESTTEKSDLDKALDVVNTLGKITDKLSDEERKIVAAALSDRGIV